jgi:hypothetical protein
MKELEVGNRVRGSGSSDTRGGYTGTVYSIQGSKATIKRDDKQHGGGEFIPDYGSGWSVTKKSDGTWGADTLSGTLTIISEEGCMGLKECFILSLAKEPQKSFWKAGITNGDDLLTDEGAKVFLSWLLHNKFSEDFKKDVVDDLLKDQNDKKA